MRFSVYLMPLMLFSLIAVFLWFGLNHDPRELPSTRLGQTIPAFELENLPANRVVTQEQLKGQVSLLNVWATWCPACEFEHESLVKLSEQGIPIYGLNYKDRRTSARQWLAAYGNPYKLTVFDQQGSLAMDLGVYGAPETFLIDADGIIRYRHAGPITQAVWQEVLEPQYRAIAGLGSFRQLD